MLNDDLSKQYQGKTISLTISFNEKIKNSESFNQRTFQNSMKFEEWILGFTSEKILKRNLNNWKWSEILSILKLLKKSQHKADFFLFIHKFIVSNTIQESKQSQITETFLYNPQYFANSPIFVVGNTRIVGISNLFAKRKRSPHFVLRANRYSFSTSLKTRASYLPIGQQKLIIGNPSLASSCFFESTTS